MDYGLRGRVALVTGGSRGLGKRIAESFATEGAAVAITYARSQRLADAVARSICASGGDASAVALELEDAASITAAVQQVIDRYGRLDALVHNAVRWPVSRPSQACPFEDIVADEWLPVLRANVEGAHVLMQAAIRPMRERRWGRIVNISSVAALDGLPGASTYAMAKSALHGLTISLAAEVGRDGILVNAAAPSLTLTEQILATVPRERREAVAKSSVIGRLLTPTEVASMIVFLSSAANTSMTGQILRLGGE